MQNNTRNICVLRLSALGDCINAYGLICAMKKASENISVSWVIDSRFASLFVDSNGNELVDLIKADIKNQGILKTFVSLRKRLKHKRYDYLLNIQTSIKASILSLCVKAKTKIGYDKQRSREGQRFFVNKIIDTPQDPHVLSGFLSFAKSIGLDEIKPVWDFCLTKNELTKAEELLNTDKKVFCISPASAKSIKNWTVDGYSAIAQYAHEKGFDVVLLGSNAEKEKKLCSDIESKLSFKCNNLCGKTSLRELCAVVSKSSLVLSPDSACMHLASAQNIPVIGLFAIHNPNRVGAYNFRDIEVSVYEQEASKELKEDNVSWRYRVKNENAMKNISISDVKKAFDLAVSKYIEV